MLDVMHSVAAAYMSYAVACTAGLFEITSSDAVTLCYSIQAYYDCRKSHLGNMLLQTVASLQTAFAAALQHDR
jgi:hypothetical protein